MIEKPSCAQVDRLPLYCKVDSIHGISGCGNYLIRAGWGLRIIVIGSSAVHCRLPLHTERSPERQGILYDEFGRDSRQGVPLGKRIGGGYVETVSLCV